MYSNRDSIEIYNSPSEPFIKISTINNVKIGILIEKSLMKLYHLINGYFQLTSKDSVEGSNWNSMKIDLNFDGYLDLVLYEVAGAHGNSFSTSLIFNSKNKKFKHLKKYDLPNLEIDQTKKLLRSKWYSSACGNSKKAIFSSINDSVELIESIQYFDSKCGEIDHNKRYLIFIEKRNKGKIFKDSIQLKPKEAWTLFEQSIWNTKNEW
jgi:hypothetical protein